jgi:O-antigen/teichoic acid export membrane protein
MALVTTLAGLIGVFLNLGMNNAVQRFYWDPQTSPDRRPVLVSTGLWVLLGWSILATMLTLLLLFPWKESIFRRYDVVWSYIFLSLLSNIPLVVLQYSLDVLRLRFSPWLFTFVSAWKNLAGVLTGLFMILVLKWGLLGLFWGNLLGLIIAIPLGIWFIRQEIGFTFDRSVAQEIIRFGYPFIFAGLAYWVFGSMDRWMLGWLSNNTEVGLYSIAFKFSTILIFINAAIGQAWSPYAMKVYAEDPGYRLTFSKALSISFLGLTLVGCLVSVFGLEMLRLITPEAYWPAANTIGILTMGMVLAGTTQITALGISIERRTKLFGVGSWTAALLNLFLNWLLIPKLGALGAGIATFLSYLLLSSFYLFWSQRLHPIPLRAKELSCSMALMALSLLVSFYLNRLNWSGGILLLKILFMGLAFSLTTPWVLFRTLRAPQFSGVAR